MTSESRCLGRMYRDGEVICRQGELGECIYVVQEGQAEIMVRSGEKEFCLGVLEKGDFFGEAEAFEGGVRSATLRAVGAALIMTIDKRTFMHSLHEDPSMAVRIIRKLSKRVQRLQDALMRSADPAVMEQLSAKSN